MRPTSLAPRLVAALFALVPALRAAPAAAQQVTKPTGTVTTLDRLPAPAPIVARQEADGRIRVTWKSLPGAARYQLYRSVPNSGQGYVTLPTPTDTTYLDADVKTGLAYYYVVNAVDERGVTGLKAGAQPVTATTSATGGATVTTTGTTATGVAPPSEVKAQIIGYPHGQVYFRSTQGGVRFAVERGIVTGSGTTFTALGTQSCCFYYDQGLATTLPAGTRVVYRVTAVDSVTPANRSAAVLSNEITTYRVESTFGGVIKAATAVPGDTTPTVNLFVGSPVKDWTNRRIASFDPTVVEVTTSGGLLPRTAGVAWVTVIGTRGDGEVKTIVYRVEVTPR